MGRLRRWRSALHYFAAGSRSPMWFGGRRLDLRERRALGGADPDDDPVADDELRGVDHGRHLALPEQEDRLVAEGERLVARWPISRRSARRSPPVTCTVTLEVPTDVSVPRKRYSGLSGLKSCVPWSPTMPAGCCSISARSEPRGARTCTHTKSPAARSPALHDGRDAVRPLQELGVRAVRERLRDGLAEHRLQRGLVAALHRDRDAAVRRASRSAGRGTSSESCRARSVPANAAPVAEQRRRDRDDEESWCASGDLRDGTSVMH